VNIINKLTIRHLKENKRRSLVTIVGVIISVAMITAVATLGVSFLNLMIRQDIVQNGEWHVQYKDVNKEQIAAIKEDDSTEKLILASAGYAYLPGSENESKPYLFFRNYNEIGYKQFPIKVSEGRLPLTENEIIISEEIGSNANVKYEIGDQLTVDVGDRISERDGQLTQNYSLSVNENGEVVEELQNAITKTVTIVGTMKRPSWEPAWSPGYTVIGYVDDYSLNTNDTIDAYVVVKDVNGSLYKNSEEMAQQNNIEKVIYNDGLLRYYGVTDNDDLRLTLFSLAGIIMGVIIIGSVALIYNAFAISVSERARHLGMLSSIGATKKQKRNSVFFEGAIIGAISIPIGIIAGLAGIGVTFAFINTYLDGALNVTEKLQLVVTPASILVACAISIVTIFISTFIPARKASKISAIDAIRQTHDIKLTRKAVKTSKIVRNIFGLEAEIGLKNVKRNRKRYLATVFSLVVSIVLFLSVSYFTENLKKSLGMSQNDYNFDIRMYSGQMDAADYQTFTKLEHVTKSSIIQKTMFNAWIDESEISKELRELVKEDSSILDDGKYPYFVELNGLDEEDFQDYADQVGVNLEDVQNSETPTAIIIDEIKYQDGETGNFVETKSIHTKLGEVIELFTTSYEDEESEFVNKVVIGGLTDQVPMGVDTSSIGGLNVIVSEKTMKQIMTEKTEDEVATYLYINTSDPMATQEAIEEITDSNVDVYNVFQRRQQAEQVILLMSVFTYGFIALISLISIANIFNTISTSISLRKREFAMLRSVGMTPKGFNKMINYESIFYGVNALIYGLPISILVMFGIHWSLGNTFDYGFTLPWKSILFVIVIIFVIVSSAMLYSISKIKKENIIDGLKQENI